jgi:hypothetical protein
MASSLPCLATPQNVKRQRKEKEGGRVNDREVPCVTSYGKKFGAFIWELLVEWKYKFRPTKI